MYLAFFLSIIFFFCGKVQFSCALHRERKGKQRSRNISYYERNFVGPSSTLLQIPHSSAQNHRTSGQYYRTDVFLRYYTSPLLLRNESRSTIDTIVSGSSSIYSMDISIIYSMDTHVFNYYIYL